MVRKPADPVENGKISLDDFAATQRPTPGAGKAWLEAHPDARDQALRGLRVQRYSVAVVHRWLKQQYGYPLSPESLRRLRD